MTGQTLETTLTLNTADLDRGAARYERAMDRIGQASAEAAKKAEALQFGKMSDGLAREAKADRIRITRETYQELERLDKNYHAGVAQRLKLNGIREGISPGGRAAQRVGSGGGGGGHGGHGGGLLGGNNARMVGDALDGITGHSGWVMRMRGLQMGGAALGRMLGPLSGAAAVGFAGFKGAKADLAGLTATAGLQHAMGERADNPALKQGLTGPLLRLLPKWLQPDPYTVPRLDGQSREGMSAQREEITAAVKKNQDSRSGWRAFTPGGAANNTASFRAEERAQDKLLQLDTRQAHLVKERTAAQRVGVFQSEHEVELAKNKLDLEEKLATLRDQAAAGKIGGAEYAAGVKGAKSEKEIADFETEQKRKTFARETGRGAEQNYIRKKGVDVEARSAYADLQAARDKLKNAPTEEARRSAQVEVGAAEEAHRRAVQTTAARNVNLRMDTGVANLRGSADANRQQEAAAEVMRARQLATLAHTDVEQKEAALQLARALRGQEELRMQVESRRVGFAQANFARQQQTAAARIGLAQGTTAGTVAQANASVATAAEGVANARRNQAIEKNSESSVQATTQAEADLRDAVLARAATLRDIKNSRADELKLTKGEVDATRLANAGYGARAALLREQLSNHQAIVQALRDGKTELAAQLEKMGELNVQAARYARFFNADGTKRHPRDIIREDHATRREARAKERFDARTAANHGLRNIRRDMSGRIIDGEDALDPEHGRRLTPRQMDQRYPRDTKGAQDQVKKEQGSAGTQAETLLNSIWTELKNRLPVAGNN